MSTREYPVQSAMQPKPYARVPRTAHCVLHRLPQPPERGAACVAACAVPCEYLMSTLEHPISTLGVPREYPCAPYQHPRSTP